MKARDVARYCRDLGWRDALDVPEFESPIQSSPTTDVASLEDLARSMAGCDRCRLCEHRTNIVFGEGHPTAELMFIGEAPGADEDRTGRPFVGQAGRLLDELIFALGLERRQVYIGNVVKCRPPGNRDPQQDEMAACAGFLDRQVELIRPRAIVALGRVAVRRLTGSEKPMGALRGRWTSYRGIPLMAMFHPAYLLRNELAKRQVWQDLKLIRQRLSRADTQI